MPLPSRRADERPDQRLISGLIRAQELEDRLSMDELIGTSILLLVAGHETTTNLIGNGMLALLQHPEAMAELRARPELMPNAVEELLRYVPPAQTGFRTIDFHRPHYLKLRVSGA